MSVAHKIDAKHPFVDRDVILNLANGISETLTKLVTDITVDFEKPFVEKNWSSPSQISVYLKLNTEPYRGQIIFHFDKNVTIEIIKKMTGSEVLPNSEEILDGVAEISNIFYGAAKAKLNSLGYKLDMSLPNPCWTKNLPSQIVETKSMVLPFKVNQAQCFTEIILF